MSNNQVKYKYEIAQELGITSRTLRNWLNVKYYQQLKAIGYTKNQKYLLPNQLKYLNEKLCIVAD